MFVFQGASQWSDRAIHDTVAAVVNGAAYRRGIAQSILGRIIRMIFDTVVRIADAVQKVPHGRTIAIVCTIVIVAAIAARVVLAKRLRDEQARVRIARGRGGARHVDPWSASRMLADEGRYTEAAHALYQAVLENLSANEGVRLHPSKTSGDYQRELRRKGSRNHGAFRSFSRHYDAMIFGRGACTEEEYRSLLVSAMEIASQRMAA